MPLLQGPRLLTLDEVEAGTNQETARQSLDSNEFGDIERGLSDFIKERRSSISALSCVNSECLTELTEDCENNAPTLLAISTFLDSLLPKMDKTVLGVSQVQFETLSRVRGLIGEDFIDDFTERCDRISVPVDRMRTKLAQFKHRYLTDPELDASVDLHTLLTEVNTVYTEWIQAVANGEFNDTVKRNLLPSNAAASEDDDKLSEEELAVWGLNHAIPSHVTKQRVMTLLDMASENAPAEEIVASLGNDSKKAIAHIINLSRNTLCYLRSSESRQAYFDKGVYHVEGIRSLSRDMTSVLASYRQIDQQLGLYLADGAYEIIDAEKAQTA